MLSRYINGKINVIKSKIDKLQCVKLNLVSAKLKIVFVSKKGLVYVHPKNGCLLIR